MIIKITARFSDTESAEFTLGRLSETVKTVYELIRSMTVTALQIIFFTVQKILFCRTDQEKVFHSHLNWTERINCIPSVLFRSFATVTMLNRYVRSFTTAAALMLMYRSCELILDK